MKNASSAGSIHEPVMLEESMLVLKPHDGGIYVDGTLGGGSHTRALLERSAPSGQVLSFDVDPVAIERAQALLAPFAPRWTGIEANTRHLAQELQAKGIKNVDGILLDLGVSSDEIENPALGLSFRLEGPLDMRLGPRANDDGLTAAAIVNQWNASDLIKVLRFFWR
jgi:16S rRNA (cytosine1402-N4)-methyltransferase